MYRYIYIYIYVCVCVLLLLTYYVNYYQSSVFKLSLHDYLLAAVVIFSGQFPQKGGWRYDVSPLSAISVSGLSV